MTKRDNSAMDVWIFPRHIDFTTADDLPGNQGAKMEIEHTEAQLVIYLTAVLTAQGANGTTNAVAAYNAAVSAIGAW